MSDEYWPNPDFSKIAVLVEVADPQAITEIKADFGRQRMVGSFYVVADGEGSYGAARTEFEASHRQLGDSKWVKSSPVTAHQLGVADEPVRIRTMIGGAEEGSVMAQPGDWIVEQASGERMVVTADEFRRRYRSEGPS